MKVIDFSTLMVLTLIAVVCLLVFPVFADPAPPPTHPVWFVYSEEVLCSEVAAWFVGAELLWRLLRKRKQEVSRSESYKIMLVVMIISFLIGLLFWKIFEWI